MTCSIPVKSVTGRVAVLDVETTGLNPRISEVLQLAIIDADDGSVIVNRFYDSRFDSWPEAQAVNRIAKTMVAGYPYFTEDVEDISKVLAEFDAIAGYNISFDLEFLRRAGVRIPRVPVVDLMIDFAEYKNEKVLKRWKLSEACAWAGCDLFKAHDAVYDCQATLALYNKLKVI